MLFETFNRDITPPDDLAAAYPGVSGLTHSSEIAGPFALAEAQAKRWKRIHQTLGRTALLAVMCSVSLIVYDLTVGRLFGSTALLDVSGAAIAAVGLTAQGASFLSAARKRWLIARFTAERLRCLKFQAFLVAIGLPPKADLTAEVRDFTHRNVAKLRQELRGGWIAIVQFSAADHLITPPRPRQSQSRLRMMAEVYETLRMRMQLQHLESRLSVLEERSRLPTLFSVWLVMAGGVLALLDILLVGFPYIAERVGTPERLWIQFLTLLSFSLGASLWGFIRGETRTEEELRYRQYARAISAAIGALAASGPQGLGAMAVRVEELALRELEDFCGASVNASYGV